MNPTNPTRPTNKPLPVPSKEVAVDNNTPDGATEISGEEEYYEEYDSKELLFV